MQQITTGTPAKPMGGIGGWTEGPLAWPQKELSSTPTLPVSPTNYKRVALINTVHKYIGCTQVLHSGANWPPTSFHITDSFISVHLLTIQSTEGSKFKDTVSPDF